MFYRIGDNFSFEILTKKQLDKRLVKARKLTKKFKISKSKKKFN